MRLQVRLQKRMTRGLMFMARYTYSKSLDDASTIGGGGQTVIQNNADPRGDYGLSSFNMTHQFLGQFSYQLPFGDRQRFATKGWEKAVFGAWRVNGIVHREFRHALHGAEFSRKIRPARMFPARTPSAPTSPAIPPLSNPTVLEWFNTAAFSIPTGVLWRCAAEFRDRPGRVHDQFGTVENDSSSGATACGGWISAGMRRTC